MITAVFGFNSKDIYLVKCFNENSEKCTFLTISKHKMEYYLNNALLDIYFLYLRVKIIFAS